jgi:hypothetical protein
MKLTKAKLLKEVHDGLIKMGYKEIKDTITGAEGLFIKPLPSGFFLSLGFTISRSYESLFTADFYLSKTTIWGATWGDIPCNSYERIGTFLTKDERMLYLDAEYCGDGVVDAWWRGDREDDFCKFLEIVRITEGRFLEQDDLFVKVERSADVKELVDHVSGVFEIVEKGINDKFEYQFKPNKPMDDIPAEWFKAAEITLKNKGGILNKNTVKRLAADAWRQRNVK